MNIGSVSQNLTLQSLQSLQGTSATSSTAIDPTSDTSTDGSSSVSLSKPGELLQKLSELQKEDPAKFKEVLGQISDSLKSASQTATGSDSTELSNIADKFASAAQNGNLSALRPSHRGGHHGGHGHGGGQGVQSSDDQSQSAQATAGVQRAYGGAARTPSAAIQDAFSSALSIVDDALSSESSSSSTSATVAA